MSDENSPPRDWSLDRITPDVLCSLGQKPYLMTGALIQHVRQHFATRSNIEEPPLRDLVWNPDSPDGIVIESATKWSPSQSGQRPAVVVKRGDYEAISLGINDEMQGWYDATGDEWYGAFLRGSHTLFCLANEAGEAERLGTEVYKDLIQASGKLREYLQLLKFKVASVGQLCRLQEAMGSYAVPITVAYSFEETWKIEPHAPRLKRISLRALIEGSSL